MQFHRQLNGHNPASGQIGDCFRTCIACFLNLSPQDVPNFVDSPTNAETDKRVNEFLAGYGLTLIDVWYNDPNLQTVCDALAEVNGEDFTYMVCGIGLKHPHVAIYRGRELLWDPAGGTGVRGPVDGLYWVKIMASLRCRYNEKEAML